MAKRFTSHDARQLRDHVVWRKPLPPEGGYTSTFNAALNEARHLTGRDRNGRLTRPTPTLWGGTLVYFALLDQIGESLRPLRGRKLATKKGRSKEPSLQKALRQFGPKRLTSTQREVLYALRCSFAHEFGLINTRSGRCFKVTDSPGGKLIVPPRTEWDKVIPNLTAANQTTVNLVTLGSLVEAVVRSVRTHAIRGTLRAEIPIPDLQRRFGFAVVPDS
jgi:hypothetical protein